MIQQSLASIYPTARKIQYELRTQLDYLESGRGGTFDDQRSARENLNQLQQLIHQLDGLVYSEPPSKREMWKKKIDQLRVDSQMLGSALENYLFRMSKSSIEQQERESLFNRRAVAMEHSNAAMYATQENQSLMRSTQMVGDLSALSQSVLGNLRDQKGMLKDAHRKVLDVANRIGLSNSLLRVIERRDTVDQVIVYGGMIVTLAFLYGCYWFVSR